MKNNIFRLSTLLMVPLLTACVFGDTKVVSDNTTAIMSTSNMTSTSISFSCQKCDGVIIYSINVKEENEKAISCNLDLSSGALTIVVKDSEGVELYNNSLNESVNYDIPLESYGKHRIELTHNEFKGSYRLSWAKKK